jgi:HK97 family phage prohead protease
MTPKICYRMAAAGQLTTTSPNSIEGIAVPYGRYSHVITNEAPRPFRERIRPRALAWDERTVMHVQHDRSGVPLARVGAGTMRLEEDSEGLRFHASLPAGRSDVIEALQRGDLDGSVSIGFIVEDDEWSHYEKQSLREVTKGRLVEVSLVTAGAYPGARGTYIPGGMTNG